MNSNKETDRQNVDISLFFSKITIIKHLDFKVQSLIYV